MTAVPCVQGQAEGQGQQAVVRMGDVLLLLHSPGRPAALQ